MAIASHLRAIDELADTAGKAMSDGRYFEAEQALLDAIGLARREGEFDRLARNVTTLEQVRRQRMAKALEVGTVTILDTPFIEEEISVEPGCLLVQPPLVGADARRIRQLAFSRKIPVMVICREPLTRLGQIPIVAIAPNATIRARVDPPQDMEHPDLDWFLDAIAAVGDTAIGTMDPEQDFEKQIDGLLARLDAVPEHDELHRCLEETCLEAHTRLADGTASEVDK